jgi:hypothetical protein
MIQCPKCASSRSTRNGTSRQGPGLVGRGQPDSLPVRSLVPGKRRDLPVGLATGVGGGVAGQRGAQPDAGERSDGQGGLGPRSARRLRTSTESLAASRLLIDHQPGHLIYHAAKTNFVGLDHSSDVPLGHSQAICMVFDIPFVGKPGQRLHPVPFWHRRLPLVHFRSPMAENRRASPAFHLSIQNTATLLYQIPGDLSVGSSRHFV